MPKIIATSLLKGGTGKTALTYNIATTEAIKKPDAKFLCIDFDMQGNLTNYFGIESFEKVQEDSSDLILGNKTPEQLLIKSPLEEVPNLDLIPSSFNLFQNEIALNNLRGNESRLKRIFDKHKDFFNQYDYIIIDTNPSFSIYNINVLYIADVILNVVKNGCVSSLKALQMQMGIWEGIKEDLSLSKEQRNVIILNMLDTRTKNSKQFIENIFTDEQFKDLVLNTTVRNSVVFANAMLNNKPLYLYNKNHKATEDILNITRELEDKNIF